MNTLSRLQLCTILAAAIALSGCAMNPWQQKSFDPADQDSMDPLAKTGKKTADKDSHGFSRRLSQGRGLETSGKLDEARPIYEKLLVDYPDRVEPYHRLAVVADRQRRHREAQALYTEALERKPNDPELFNDLGYCFFLQGQLSKAESAIGKAVAMAPANCKYRNNLGLVYGHQQRFDEALEAFRRGGSEADAQYNMAFVLAAQDDVAGAKERFHLALTADPTYAPARKALKSFEKAESDPELLSEDANDRDVRLVPYVEGSAGDVGKASREAQVASAANSTSPPPSSAKNRSLQSQAREMMQQRLSGQ